MVVLSHVSSSLPGCAILVVLFIILITPTPCPTHIELHFCITAAAFHAELLKLGQHPQKLPLALVHEDALVELHLFWQAPKGDVDVLDWETGKQASAGVNANGMPEPVMVGCRVVHPHGSSSPASVSSATQ